jgi:hypothetical protein
MSNRIKREENDTQIHCGLAAEGSICLCWRRFLTLQLNYQDVVEALACLDDLFEQPTWSFSLGGDGFCAFLAQDGFYYLLCHERIVLRLSEQEARCLRCQLASVRAKLDGEVNLLLS